jgi:rod shape-determining protein MreC
MKKIFSSKFVKIFLFLAAISLVAFLSLRGFLNGPKNLAYKAFLPFQKIFYRAGTSVSDYAGAIFTLPKIINKNKNLTEENLKLQADLSKMSEIARENSFLKERFDLPDDPDFNYVLANVVGYDPISFGQVVFIDKGSSSGIEKNYPVVTTGNVLIGLVSEVSDSTAKIQLITDPESAVNVVSQDNRSTGILKGGEGDLLLMEMIPQDKNVDIGEKIITSGLGGIFPKGLLSGTVEKIISSDADAFKKAQVKPVLAAGNLGVALIIAPR